LNVLKRRTFVIIVLALTGVGGLVAWHLINLAATSTNTKSQSRTIAVPVTAGIARRGDVPDYVQVLGTVQSMDSVSVQSRVSGQIVQIYFKPGQDVKKGQPLFLVDPRPYQAMLDQTQGQLTHDEAVLQEAQVDLRRYQELAKTKAINEQQVDDQTYIVQQAEGTVRLDEANVENAKLNLDYCHIASPIDGRAGALLVDLGNIVQATAATSLVSITQIHPIFVSFAIPQTMLDEVRQNQAKGALDVEVSSQSGRLIGKGKLTLVDNQVNVSTGTVTLQGTFPNQDEALWPGEFVKMRLTIFIRKNVISVPARTVMQGPNGPYVYVIKHDDTVQRVAVHVVARQDGIAVIDQGLSGTERVVTNGQYRLANNVKVKLQPAKMPG
jgi:multidrug efflux system membrane fusion protein